MCLFYATSSCVHHFIAIGQFKLELQSGNAKFGSKSAMFFFCLFVCLFFVPCELANWKMTLKSNKAPLLCHSKLCASFHCRVWIQIGVTVRKRPSWTLTFDFLTLTSCIDITSVITPENFMMIRTDRQTDGRTDLQADRRTEKIIHRAAWSQLKMNLKLSFLL